MAIIDKRKTYLKEFKALVIDRLLRRHHAFEHKHTHTHTHTHTYTTSEYIIGNDMGI